MMSKVLKSLIKGIVSGDLVERMNASMKLQDLIEENPDQKKSVAPLFIDILKKEKEISKLGWAILTAGIFEIDETKPILRDLLKHKEDIIREETALALGMLKDEEIVDELIKIVKNKKDAAREEAAFALGQIGDTKALDVLINHLNDDEDMVIATCLALSKLHDPRAIKPLTKTLLNDNKYIRKEAGRAIFTFGRDALDDLKKVSKEAPYKKRKFIFKLMNEIDRTPFP